MSDTLSVHICTRNRPDTLGRLLAELERFVESPLRIFVYDDSQGVMDQSRNRRVVAQTASPSVYVNEVVRRQWLRDVPWPSPEAAKFPDYAFKTLGQPGWDASGVRGFAHFTAACTAGDRDPVLFLDDDIGLPTRYSSNWSVTEQLSAPFDPGEIVGTKFSGRPDVYLVEYLTKYSKVIRPRPDDRRWIAWRRDMDDRRRRGEISGFAPEIVADRGEWRSDLLPEHEIPCGGGFLLMHGADVRGVPIPHCYNEDLIFLAGLLADPHRSLRVAGSVRHDPHPQSDPEAIKPTLAAARSQLLGFSVQKGIEEAYHRVGTEDFGALAEEAIRHCERLMPVMEEAWQNLLEGGRFTPWNDLDEAGVRRLLDDPPRAEAAEVITEYLGHWPAWNEAVGSPDVRESIQRAALQQLERPQPDAEQVKAMVVGLPPAPHSTGHPTARPVPHSPPPAHRRPDGLSLS